MQDANTEYTKGQGNEIQSEQGESGDMDELQCKVEPYKGNENYIFVSYSHKDKAQVFPIIEQMTRDGYRVWYDEGIDPGTEWPEFIAEHLSGCLICIAFISVNSLESQYCRNEIGYAISEKKIVVPVHIEQVKLERGMKMQLSSREAIYKYKYTVPSEKKFYERLYSTDRIAECGSPDAVKAPAVRNTDRSASSDSVAQETFFTKLASVLKPAAKGENSVSSRSGGRNAAAGERYSTLTEALKAASKRGIITLKTEKKKQYIIFGSYDMEIWNDEKKKAVGDGIKEPLEWEILDYSAEKQSVFVVCRNVITCRQYNDKRTDITWEQCTLRRWLNKDFYEVAFRVSERELIIPTVISNPDNAQYGTKGGNDTEDRIFLLSLDEVNRYFSSSSERVRRNASGARWWWWVRSPGDSSYYAADVFVNGGVADGGFGVIFDDGGVCPAFWINLNPEI